MTSPPGVVSKDQMDHKYGWFADQASTSDRAPVRIAVSDDQHCIRLNRSTSFEGPPCEFEKAKNLKIPSLLGALRSPASPSASLSLQMALLGLTVSLGTYLPI